MRGVGRDTRKMWRKERMKNDPEFKKTVIKRQVTTARRNLKSDNPFKKLTGEVYKQNKIARVVCKVLRKAGVELPGLVNFEQGLSQEKGGELFQEEKRISKKGLKKKLLGALNIETGEDLMPDLIATKERKPRGPVSEATQEMLRAKALTRHAAKLLDPNYKPKSVKVKKEKKKKLVI